MKQQALHALAMPEVTPQARLHRGTSVYGHAQEGNSLLLSALLLSNDHASCIPVLRITMKGKVVDLMDFSHCSQCNIFPEKLSICI